jgi:3-dehydroquinate synthase
MPNVRVALGERSYDIVIADESLSLSDFLCRCLPPTRQALIVSDSNTQTLARSLFIANGWTIHHAVVPAGEGSKSLTCLKDLYSALAAIPADRQTAVIAVGGGVIGDLAGFAAATYNRGLPLIMVPTTLLAMVDSSVGGKTGINIAAGKNLVGSFHQPSGVWIDPQMLRTLPDREFQSGMAEVVKYGAIADASFFADLERDAVAIQARENSVIQAIVQRCCRIKADVVEQDEFERTGVRATLNYGHTFAHAFEAVAGYGSWLHGEAVAAGMVCASRLAERKSMITSDLTDRLIRLLKQFQLPTDRDSAWSIDALIDAMQRDKKASAGRLRFILPTNLGSVLMVNDVDETLVRDVLGNRSI